MPDTISPDRLTEADVGRWVARGGDGVCGRIKSWNRDFAFVVFRCSAEWDLWKDYKAERCEFSWLTFCDEPEHKSAAEGEIWNKIKKRAVKEVMPWEKMK